MGRSADPWDHLTVENDAGWATNRLTPGKIILGNLGGIETGIRQLLRKRPTSPAR